MLRIGHGYDAHRFADAASLRATGTLPADGAFPDDNEVLEEASLNSESIVMGGVTIPYSTTLLAHSDGDVLVHALCDALLGALALGDIGKHFPDTEAEFENIDSRILLRMVMHEVQQAGYQVSNADMTIIAQAPKMADHIETMCINLADDMNVSRSQVNVKATTTEKMGFTGRKEGISTHAMVLLENNYDENKID